MSLKKRYFLFLLLTIKFFLEVGSSDPTDIPKKKDLFKEDKLVDDQQRLEFLAEQVEINLASIINNLNFLINENILTNNQERLGLINWVNQITRVYETRNDQSLSLQNRISIQSDLINISRLGNSYLLRLRHQNSSTQQQHTLPQAALHASTSYQQVFQPAVQQVNVQQGRTFQQTTQPASLQRQSSQGARNRGCCQIQ